MHTYLRILTDLQSLVEPLCTPVSPTVCRRKSQLLRHHPWRSRSLHHLSESTRSGLVVPFWLPSQPSSKCGSPSRSMTRADLPSFTASASKVFNISWTSLPLRRTCLTYFLCSIFHTIYACITNFTNMTKDEDSSKACVPRVLLSHDAFTFRKVLVAMERLGALILRTDIWLILGWLFCLEEWSAHCRLSIN